jgi:hypothetical protein
LVCKLQKVEQVRRSALMVRLTMPMKKLAIVAGTSARSGKLMLEWLLLSHTFEVFLNKFGDLNSQGIPK